jgi:hypothetical protein
MTERSINMDESHEVLDDAEDVNDPKGIGTLYVMRERDWLSGESNDYFKIGIVNGKKTIEGREKSHQTGNPRNIWTHHEWQNVPAVQRLETRIHNSFALDRISSGEWFYLPGDRLGHAIDSIQSILEHHNEAISNLTRIESVKGLRDCKEKLESSEYVLNLAHLCQLAASSLTVHKKNRESIRQKLVELVGTSDEFAHLFKSTEVKETHKFLASIAKAKFPKIAPEFEVVLEMNRQLFFTLPKQNKEEIKSAVSELTIDESILNSSDPITLHRAFLEEWSMTSQREWEANSFKWEIQALCGEHLGVEGLVEWRPMSKKDFNRKSFQEKYPDEFAQCFKTEPKHVTQNVAEWASYGR